MDNDKLDVGMIGVGGYGSVRRALMRETGLFRIVRCLDRNKQALQAACVEENARPCTDLQEMLDDPCIQAVVISTGADTHAEMAMAAMRAGKHVFVEKPLCTSVDEVERLRETAKETRAVVGVGHTQTATDPMYRLVREFIEHDKLGVVTAYEENASHSGGLHIKAGDWRGMAERNPGGMLFHCGVHSLHRLSDLFGPVDCVQAMMRYDVNPNTQTADAANVLLQHESGVIGTLNCYHVTAYCHELRVFGTKGNLYIDTFVQRAWYQQALYGPVEPRVEVSLPHAAPLAKCANLIAWYNAVRGRGEADPGLEHGVCAVLPVFAAELSQRSGTRITVDQQAMRTTHEPAPSRFR